VRPPDVRAAEGIIPGAVAAHAAKIDAVIEIYTGEQATIVYSAYPNEASAATAAKHLRHRGLWRALDDTARAAGSCPTSPNAREVTAREVGSAICACSSAIAHIRQPIAYMFLSAANPADVDKDGLNADLLAFLGGRCCMWRRLWT
jgi:hypothetical protein